ncbi:carbohydrate sulfotransferase 3-like [Pollicipes pollicipes]|uniref:carbohydrate sulfotransferase 3-like n=1 Tax=Pollicipes pollicipes TaxID=41117 RepID=UPI001884A640|nr:carbohydrate sulfotransferase 3-like [Pollicipes pollicipes]
MTSRRTAKELFFCTCVLLLLISCFQVLRPQPHIRKFVNLNSAPVNTLDDPSKPVLLIITASSPRSGSSFLGEMMSSPSRSAFMFEPFWFHEVTLSQEMNTANSTAHIDLYNLLTCRLSSLPRMFAQRSTRDFIWRKPMLPPETSLDQMTATCLKQPMRVVKIIRIRLRNLLPLLEAEGLNVYIVHLVRDPRGILNSLLRQRHEWPERLHVPQHICGDMWEDIQLWRDVTSPRLSIVRYEDVAANPLREARRLFANMKVPLPRDVFKFVETHTRVVTEEKGGKTKLPEENGGNGSDRNRYSNESAPSHANATRARRSVATQRLPNTLEPLHQHTTRRHHRSSAAEHPPRRRAAHSGLRRATRAADRKIRAVRSHMPQVDLYYGTVRSAKFDELHWRRELAAADRRAAERECGAVLQALGYPLRYPSDMQGGGGGK